MNKTPIFISAMRYPSPRFAGCMGMVMVFLMTSFGLASFFGLASLLSPVEPPQGVEWQVADNPTVPALEGQPAVLVDININTYTRTRSGTRRNQCHREQRGTTAIQLKRQGKTKLVKLRVISDLRGKPERIDATSLDSFGLTNCRCPGGVGGYELRVQTLRVGQSVMLTPGPVLTVGSFDELMARRLKARKKHRFGALFMLTLFALATAAALHFFRRARVRGRQAPWEPVPIRTDDRPAYDGSFVLGAALRASEHPALVRALKRRLRRDPLLAAAGPWAVALATGLFFCGVTLFQPPGVRNDVSVAVTIVSIIGGLGAVLYWLGSGHIRALFRADLIAAHAWVVSARTLPGGMFPDRGQVTLSIALPDGRRCRGDLYVKPGLFQADQQVEVWVASQSGHFILHTEDVSQVKLGLMDLKGALQVSLEGASSVDGAG